MTAAPCHAARESVHKTVGERLTCQCNEEAELSEEHKKLTAKLAVWQQQIRRLVQREAQLPERARSDQHDAGNQMLCSSEVATVLSTTVASSQSQPGVACDRGPAPLRSIQSSNQSRRSVQQIGNAASHKHSRPPPGSRCQSHGRCASLVYGDGLRGAEARRERMQPRLQDAAVRRAKAQELAQVSFCSLFTARWPLTRAEP